MLVIINGKICWSIVKICSNCNNLCKITEKNITKDGEKVLYFCFRCKSKLEISKEDIPKAVYDNLNVS